MKGLIIVLVFSFFIAIVTSCSNSENKSAEIIVADGPIANEEEFLQLNGGEKWKVPYDMMWLIQQQKDKLFEFTQAGDTTYSKLGKELDSLCTGLVQMCTMTGDGHNNLHLWLLPYWDIIDQIKVSSDPIIHEQLIDSLWGKLELFEEYFEEEIN